MADLRKRPHDDAAVAANFTAFLSTQLSDTRAELQRTQRVSNIACIDES